MILDPPLRPTLRAVLVEEERGSALLIVLIVSILLAVLVLSMSFTVMTDFSMGNDMEKKKRALETADAGYSAVKINLRGVDLSETLQAITVVPRYINYPEPTAGTDADNYFQRNPVAPMELMNVDFESLPGTIGEPRPAKGFLTPPGGVSLGNGARYFAKITDNDDGDDDLTTDVDGTIVLRIMGIQQLGAGQISTYGGTVKNSISIIETTLKRDMSFDFKAGFTLYGPCPSAAQGGPNNLFNGGFTIDGYDHPGMTLADLTNGNPHSHVTGGDSSGINAVYDNPGGGDATASADCMEDALNNPQTDNIYGDLSDYGGAPSIHDGTQDVRDAEASNPDATNIFDPAYIMGFIKKVGALADITIPDGTNYSNDIGDDANPKITYCPGDCTLGGTGGGAGLLIVEGRLDFNANFSYHGLILVVGDGEFDQSGSNAGILGGVFVAEIHDESGQWVYGTPEITIAGNSNLYFQIAGIELGFGLIPMKQLGWRQISAEIEPSF